MSDIKWFIFHCPACKARILIDKDAEPTHCGIAAARMDGIVVRDTYGTSGAELAIFDGNALRGLLDGCEPNSTRPLAATTVVSNGGVIQLTRIEYQTLVEMAMYDLLHHGPTWEVAAGSLSNLRRMLLSRIDVDSIRREVDKLSSLLAIDDGPLDTSGPCAPSRIEK